MRWINITEITNNRLSQLDVLPGEDREGVRNRPENLVAKYGRERRMAVTERKEMFRTSGNIADSGAL